MLAYYKLVDNLETFKCKWGINQCVCEVDIDANLEVKATIPKILCL